MRDVDDVEIAGAIEGRSLEEGMQRPFAAPQAAGFALYLAGDARQGRAALLLRVAAFASTERLDGVDPDRPTILFLGRMDEPRKGLGVLCEALPAIVDAVANGTTDPREPTTLP